jgi:hypothetical protein
MRLTLATLRGGVVFDEAPPPDTEAAIARHLPDGQLVASYTDKAASEVAGVILRDLVSLSPSPKLMVLMANLQTIEHRERSRIIILK